MAKFKALLKFEFMTNSLRFKDDKIFSRIKRIVPTIIGAFCLVAIFYYAVNIIMDVFLSEEMNHEFITVFELCMMLVHLVIGVTMVTKVLFLKVDLSILKLPVDGMDVFVAKFIYLYLKQIIYSLLLSLPVLISFGLKTAQGISFYLMLLPNIIFLPLIPFLFSILLSVPVMYVIKAFKNKFIFLLMIYVLVLVAGFTLYIYALKFIINILGSDKATSVFDSGTVLKIKSFASYLYVPLILKNCILLYDYWRSLIIVLAAIGLLAALVYVFIEKSYFKFIISSKNQKSYQNKSKVVSRSPAIALMRKEFQNIFRSTNYAFQCLTVVFTTPLMVYFSSEIASSVSTPILGEGILPGIVVLVLIMFLSMGTSFSATTVTREGSNFFLTKIIPVNYTKQIVMKFLIYLFISIPAIFISTFVLAFAGFISYLDAILIAISLSFVITGNITNSIFMDIQRPQFQFLENGEVTTANKNISTSIGIGFVISFLMGVGGIFLSYFVNQPSMYYVLFGFGISFMAIGIFRLFFHLDKRYNAIEV